MTALENCPACCAGLLLPLPDPRLPQYRACQNCGSKIPPAELPPLVAEDCAVAGLAAGACYLILAFGTVVAIVWGVS